MSIEVDYVFPAGVDPDEQGAEIAVGQTVGRWDARFRHRSDSLTAHLGELVSTHQLPDGRGAATVRFPPANVEGDLATLLTMIFGRCSMDGPIKVAGLRLPKGYGVRPKFGRSGIRRRLGVLERPVVMAMFRPALGLTADDHAEMLGQVADAGLDIICDDENLADLPLLSTIQRLRACRRVLERIERETKRTVLYAVNLTGRVDHLLERARRLVGEGANALLINGLTYGYSSMEAIAADPVIDAPLILHPSFAGAICASPNYGLAYNVALGVLPAHAGVDAVLHPSHHGSQTIDREEETRLRERLRERNVFSAPTGGIFPGRVPRLLDEYGKDVILNAGGTVMEHPGGPAEGVRSFFEAFRRRDAGRSFDEEELPDGPLRKAIAKWGG